MLITNCEAEMKYVHKVQYYETDKMGVTHHSNYIRWMEEARVDLLDKIGLPYADLEERGIISPVVSLDIKYKMPSTFADDIEIETEVSGYTGIRLMFSYVMRNAATGAVVVEANSSHCFLLDNKVIALGKAFPDIHQAMNEALEKNKKNS